MVTEPSKDPIPNVPLKSVPARSSSECTHYLVRAANGESFCAKCGKVDEAESQPPTETG